MIFGMSLRHAVLGLLSLEPSTGYELTQRFDRSLRHAWHAGHSQIYPELAKLEAAGMAEVVSEGARNSRTWAVTDAGRAELNRWMIEVEPNRTQRNETAVRWFLAFLLGPAERRVVLEREIAHMEAYARERREISERAHAGGARPVMGALLDLGDRMDTVMLGWLRDQLAALD
jgi:PadR family transcriptional regulator, regulatory protein AphA